MTKRFIAYYRVSTDRQGKSGLGLEAQRTSVLAYVKSVGGELVEEHTEVESGSIRDRPVLLQSTARCRNIGATLVIARLDRLARNVAFVASLMEAGTDFVAVDAPFANKLLLHIMAAFAENERELISARTKAALAAAKLRGVRLGLHGAKLAEKRKAEAAEFAATVSHDLSLVQLHGASTLQQIADGLNIRSVTTREGAAWTPTTVSRLLRRVGPSSCAPLN